MEQQQSPAPYKTTEEERKESYFAALRRRAARERQQRIERAHARMQRWRMAMNLASLAMIFTAKAPTTREEREVESRDARNILSDQQRFTRFL